MLRFSKQQFESFDAASRGVFERHLVLWLRQERSAYVDDLRDEELDLAVRFCVAECDRLRLMGEDATQAFAAAATVYGTLSARDPLFYHLYYSGLPRAGACLVHSPATIWSRLAWTLEAEFSARSGVELIADLARAFPGPEHAEMSPEELLQKHFPERLARLEPGMLEAHLRLSEQEADKHGLSGAPARLFHRNVALLLGAHFASDPLYPWAAQAFAAEADETRKIARLNAALHAIARHTAEAASCA